MKLNEVQREYIDKKLNALKTSKFRSSFHLRNYMFSYIQEKGLDTIEKHAREIISKNLAPSSPKNDGKQTPTKNHPVFIAQHACACCCRGCLEKWHKIKKGRPLTEKEKNYIVALLMEWIEREYQKGEKEKWKKPNTKPILKNI